MMTDPLETSWLTLSQEERDRIANMSNAEFARTISDLIGQFRATLSEAEKRMRLRPCDLHRGDIGG